MKIHFIRHGKPNYSNIHNDDPIYFSNLAPLSDTGVNQANNINFDLISNSKIIISSPYTRALQTAAIISKNTNIDIIVEPLLHEWYPDKTFNSKIKDFNKFNKLYLEKNINEINCENNEEMLLRLNKIIDKYNSYDEIIIVGHQRLFSSLISKNLTYCEVYTFVC